MGQFCLFFPVRPAMPSAPSRFTLSDFDFHLPPELIAQHPAAERTGSRLLDGTGPAPQDRQFRELPALLRAGDLGVAHEQLAVVDQK